MRASCVAIVLTAVFVPACADPPPIEGAICPCPEPGYQCCVGICLPSSESCGDSPTPARAPRVMIHSEQTGRQGQVRFHGTCEPDPCTAFLWDFQDGDMSSQQSPTHMFGQPGSYRVALTAVASNGESGRDFEDVVVESLDPDPGSGPVTGPTPDPPLPPKPTCRPTASGTNVESGTSPPQSCL